jgi:hypothetical protein
VLLRCAFLSHGVWERSEALADRVSTTAIEGGSLVGRGGHVELGFGYHGRFYSVFEERLRSFRFMQKWSSTCRKKKAPQVAPVLVEKSY